MKIFMLNVNEATRPRSQGFCYPSHNNDFGVEQDFFKYLVSNGFYVTEIREEADWHYLPVYWTRWHLNHNYGAEGTDKLQRYIDATVYRRSDY